ncbi:uncharacterized protein LOC107261491 [Ricinus communis]|uniref:uncharacterized protein LOC107261491 n=1 Tax=Ricinus communis TaxID=3988 RepID=UPI000D693488|nr:uncharacterized protein LOC107261491 [Ricinus communis]|eukprot:XP_025013672.1 uncharacterized protein LOC107261491 [Ricinus communis]
MPKYAKFLKEPLSNKRKLEEMSMVQLLEKSSTIIQRRLPKKLKDLRIFTIPYFIGNLNVDNVLADLGASISVMPYKLFKKLWMGEPKPTLMSIQVADKSIVYPRGIIEDLLVKVQGVIFSVDFVVMDMDESIDVSLILERPFLATARAIIDVHDGKLIIRVGEEQVTFQIPNAMKHPLVLYDMDVSNDRVERETEQKKCEMPGALEQLAYLEAAKPMRK